MSDHVTFSKESLSFVWCRSWCWTKPTPEWSTSWRERASTVSLHSSDTTSATGNLSLRYISKYFIFVFSTFFLQQLFDCWEGISCGLTRLVSDVNVCFCEGCGGHYLPANQQGASSALPGGKVRSDRHAPRPANDPGEAESEAPQPQHHKRTQSRQHTRRQWCHTLSGQRHWTKQSAEVSTRLRPQKHTQRQMAKNIFF